MSSKTLFMRLFRIPAKVTTQLTRSLEQVCRINIYEDRGDALVRHRGLFFRDEISFQAMATWRVEPEMVFDIVYITLVDGTTTQWLDSYGNLVSILRKKVANKEVGSEDK